MSVVVNSVAELQTKEQADQLELELEHEHYTVKVEIRISMTRNEVNIGNNYPGSRESHTRVPVTKAICDGKIGLGKEKKRSTSFASQINRKLDEGSNAIEKRH
jgi:hypothetical protein